MRILLIDDHPLIQAAVQSVMLGLQGDVELTGAQSASQARQILAQDSDFDLILLDLTLGDASGHDLLHEFREAYPAMPVVVLSASEHSTDIVRSIDAGAMGFVSKRSTHDELIRALKTVMSGGLYIPHDMMESDSLEQGPATLGSSGSATQPAPTAPGDPLTILRNLGLTPRQTEVLIMLLKGFSNKLIARGLNLSVETVKDHVAAVLRTLGVNTRTQAVLVVSQMMQTQGVFPGWMNAAKP